MVLSARVVFHVKHFALGHQVDRRSKEAQRRGDCGEEEQRAFSGLCFLRSDANMLDRAKPD